MLCKLLPDVRLSISYRAWRLMHDGASSEVHRRQEPERMEECRTSQSFFSLDSKASPSPVRLDSEDANIQQSARGFSAQPGFVFAVDFPPLLTSEARSGRLRPGHAAHAQDSAHHFEQS